jgi:hypothetical protein
MPLIRLPQWPKNDPHLNALDKLDADVNKLVRISSTALSVSRHNRLLLACVLASKAFGIGIAPIDLLELPNYAQRLSAHLTTKWEQSK